MTEHFEMAISHKFKGNLMTDDDLEFVESIIRYRSYLIKVTPAKVFVKLNAGDDWAEVQCAEDDTLYNTAKAYIDFLYDRSSDEDEQRAKHLDEADRAWQARRENHEHKQDNYEESVSGESYGGTESDE